MHCSAAPCPAPAVVLFTARGGTGDARYRAATACEHHRRETRRWVAGAGPTVQETPIAPTEGDPEPATLF